MRKLYVILVLILFFAGYVFSASRMEKILAEGDDLLLPLAPVDPRALLMGDYMDLDYTLNNEIWRAYKSGGKSAPSEYAVVKAEKAPFSRAVSFSRFDDGTPLGEGEYRVRFKVRGSRVTSAAPAFYFEEGQGRRYERARYGRVKIGPGGKTLLVALCDENEQDIAAARGKE